MQDECALVEENRRVGTDAWLLRVRAAAAAAARPGQFAMLRPHRGWDPLLRRPLGILRSEPPHLWFFFQVVGRGTERLAGLRPGDRLDLLAPLGTAFPEPQNRMTMLVAGGRGVVPLLFYARRFATEAPLHVVYGARTGGELHLVDWLAELPLAGLHLCTDDGSRGLRALAPDRAAELLAQQPFGLLLACGPDPMLAALARNAKTPGCDRFVSLEAHMGCGFGVCHSCAVPAAAGGYIQSCSEGPVVRLEDVAWPT